MPASESSTVHPLIPRAAQARLVETLQYAPVAFVLGARQVGKSTLAEQVARDRGIDRSVTLDTKLQRDAAIGDPTGFIAGFSGAVYIDEIQRAPELLLAIKEAVDRDRRPGRFLLTGSANVLTAPRVRDALTGRAGYVRLSPFTQAELAGSTTNVVERLIAGDVPTITGQPVGRPAFVDRVIEGGYPEARGLPARLRRRWFTDYVSSVVERDLREIADARKLSQVPRLLRLLASQAGGIHVARNVARSLDMTYETVQSYTRLLETVFLVRSVPAWRPGIGAREIHAPKIFVTDTGLLASLLGADTTRIAEDDRFTGGLLENFVAMEIDRLVESAEVGVRQFHYRDRRGEIDVILESDAGDVVAIEVKARATVGPRDWQAIARLRDAEPTRFRAGVVLHTGPETVALSDRIWALPLSGLWA